MCFHSLVFLRLILFDAFDHRCLFAENNYLIKYGRSFSHQINHSTSACIYTRTRVRVRSAVGEMGRGCRVGSTPEHPKPSVMTKLTTILGVELGINRISYFTTTQFFNKYSFRPSFSSTLIW